MHNMFDLSLTCIYACELVSILDIFVTVTYLSLSLVATEQLCMFCTDITEIRRVSD